MNRKLLVVFLIVLAVAPITTLMATGFLSLDSGSPNTTDTTVTFDAATGLRATVSTTVLPRIHHHFRVDLSISMGNCAGPNGASC